MFASALASLALAVAAPEPKAQDLAGRWVLDRYVEAGVENEKRKGMHFEFLGGKVLTDEQGEEVTYTLDPKADPPRIDLRANRADSPGIYRLDGDTLTLCFPKHPVEKPERPTKFESPAGSRVVLMVLRRAKKD